MHQARAGEQVDALSQWAACQPCMSHGICNGSRNGGCDSAKPTCPSTSNHPRIHPCPTPQRYFVPIPPGGEASLEYKFRADPLLGSTPPREFIVALHLFYEVRL